VRTSKYVFIFLKFKFLYDYTNLQKDNWFNLLVSSFF